MLPATVLHHAFSKNLLNFFSPVLDKLFWPILYRNLSTVCVFC